MTTALASDQKPVITVFFLGFLNVVRVLVHDLFQVAQQVPLGFWVFNIKVSSLVGSFFPVGVAQLIFEL